MNDIEHDFWLKIVLEGDGGGGLDARAGQGGNVVYEPGIADRREYRRYSYEVVVECKVLDPRVNSPAALPAEFPAVTQNVSRTGLAVMSNAPLVADETVGIRFTHADNGPEKYRVCWSRETREGTWLSGLHRAA